MSAPASRSTGSIRSPTKRASPTPAPRSPGHGPRPSPPRARSRRYAELVKRDFVSRQLYDNALSAAGAARADVEAQARRSALGRDRPRAGPRSGRRSPGRIGRSLYTTGALVSGRRRTMPLTTIQRLDPIYRRHPAVERRPAAAARADARRPGRERQGAGPAACSKAARRIRWSGRLSFADVTVDPATGSQTIRAVFPNPQHLLLPGMFVRGQASPGRPAARHPGAAARGQPRRARPADGAGRRRQGTCPSCASFRPTAPSATTGW